jgi:gliding motility-associated-like protein
MIPFLRKDICLKFKSAISVLLFMVASYGLSAQPVWLWGKGVHSAADEIAEDVAICPQSGNVVIVGMYNSSLSSFFGSDFTGSSKGGFVAKYDPNGNVIWGFKIGDNHANICKATAVDSSGNIYVTGTFEGTTDFSGLSATPVNLTANDKDVFLAKYNSSGQLMWVQKGGGPSKDEGYSVCINLNKVFITGYYKSSASFSSLNTVANTSNENIFIVAYNLNGVIQWLADGGSTQASHGNDIAADNAAVYVTGEFKGPVFAVFNSNGSPAASLGNINQSKTDGFVLSFNTNGILNWSGLISSSDDDIVNSICVFGTRLSVTGSIKQPANFMGYSGNPVLNSGSSKDMFVAQINKTTGSTIWVKREVSTDDDEGEAIAADVSGNIYVAGYYKGSISFSGGPSYSSVGAEAEQIVVASYSSSGSLIWSNEAGDDNLDIPYGISVNSTGGIYLCGEYSDNIEFGSSTLVNNSGSNAFLTRLGCQLVSNNTISSVSNICNGEILDSISGAIPVSGIGTFIYLWEQSNDSLIWISAPGINNLNNYSPPLFTTTKFFRRKIIVTGGCSSTSISNIIKVNVDLAPTVSNAGLNQYVCESTPVTLNGNIPLVGSGVWILVSGTGSISSPTSASTTLSGLGSGTNIFQWTISNANSCPVSSSTVAIKVDGLPSVSDAGNDLSVCVSSSSINMNANLPVVGSGFWTKLSGQANIIDSLLPNTSVNNLVPGQNIFSWTIKNGICPSSVSTVTITVDELPDTAYAGLDIITDIPFVELSANIPSLGTPRWSVISGNGSFSSDIEPDATINGLKVGQNIIRWEVSNGACPSSTDDVMIYLNPFTIPNAFSPNGDGLNDRFYIKALEYYQDVKFRVFNKWGNIVYESGEYHNEWEGTNKENKMLIDDTYYYILDVMNEMEYSGYVIIKTK